MKILQVSKLYYPQIGGIEKIVRQLSEGIINVPMEPIICMNLNAATYVGSW